ncbi:MAG: 5'/3'-nucleotidase SurE [Oleiphilaceae bacterium]|nr:5'/3'-nucleotidase SurE [Oleiphilaceae bacterium]
MNLLLSNDDGVHSPGLSTLQKVLSEVAHVEVAAPDRDHSGASNALTLTRPLSATRLPNGYMCIDGTPTDCVHLAIGDMFDTPFDRVVSGINTHANLGDDILYSGTVAAAVEGRLLKQPPIAVSLVNRGNWHFETAARVVLSLLTRGEPLAVPPRTVLNVNVPDCPWDELRGIQITRLGHRGRGELPHRVYCPRGRERLWIGAAGDEDDAGPGTDFHAVKEGYVSITPVKIDMTHYETFENLSDWLKGGL